MIHEDLLHTELREDVPAVPNDLRDWGGVLARAGEPARSRRRRRLTALALAGATLAMLAATPLGGALARGVGGFSDWLEGTPGESVSDETQDRFRAVTRFPDDPELRRLLRVDLRGRTFFLYGFETGDVVCLRVAVRAPAADGQQSACVSRDDLRRSGDLILPVKANLGVEQAGPLPRRPADRAPVPRYRLTFGIAAAEVERVAVRADDGASAAALGSGAFLHVFEPGRRGNWARTVTATSGGRTDVVPISVEASGQPSLATRLPLRGPATVEREVGGGTIGWFDRRERRGLSPVAAGLDASRCCGGFVRAIYPDPDDFLAVTIGDRTLSSLRGAQRLGGDVICVGLLTGGTTSSGCGPESALFQNGPLHLSWGFSGAGAQIWTVSGVVSDVVTRLRVFLGSGETWDAPLRDNATVFRVQRAKFPLRVVGYDDDGRVVATQSIRG